MSEKKLRMVGKKPPWDEELRAWLEKYINEHPHHPTEVLSRSQYIGVPRSVLDAYIQGVYRPEAESKHGSSSGKKNGVEKAIKRFRHNIEGTIRHKYADTFVETRTWVQVQNACDTALRENAIVVVYGRPGVGKTRCLLEYARRNMSTAPVSVSCSINITALYFVQKLARRMDISDHGIAASLEDDVAERLKRYPRPLFVDQANYLTEKSLGSICYIWEETRVPIVLAGTRSLFELFMTSKLTEDVRAQLSSRIAMHYPLSGLVLEEAKAIIQRAMGADATEDVIAKIYNITKGIFRHVEMIIPRISDLKVRNSEDLASGRITLEDLITKAGSRLMLS